MESITNMTDILSANDSISILPKPLNFTTSSNPPAISLGPSLAIPYPIFIVLLLIYIIMILLASFGSLLVIIAVARATQLQTHSNAYLVNLAVSDLLLVLIACPATLAQVYSSNWPLPPLSVLCKLAAFFPLLFLHLHFPSAS